MKSRIRILAVALTVLAAAAYAIDGPSKPIKPKRGEVVFIAKLRTQPGLPMDFLRGYVKEPKRGGEPTMAYAALYAKDTMAMYTLHQIGELNTFGYFSIKPGRERVFIFPYMRISVLNVKDLSIGIPVNVEMTIPEDVTHVYLGSFVYRYSDEYFTPSELVRLDEFDEVQAELKAAFGDGFKLIRAPLKDVSAE